MTIATYLLETWVVIFLGIIVAIAVIYLGVRFGSAAYYRSKAEFLSLNLKKQEEKNSE